MIYLICKYLFSKLTHVELEYFYNHPLVKSHYNKIIISEVTKSQTQLISALPVPEPVLIEPEVSHRVEVITRMDSVTYERFEQQVSNTGVVSTTSEIEAGFKLGIQHVLQKLRTGYVIPHS